MQGSKALANAYAVRPAEALKMVRLVDVPGVREAVEQIMTAERAEAERQAETLRAKLAELEARLAELRYQMIRGWTPISSSRTRPTTMRTERHELPGRHLDGDPAEARP